MATTTKKPKAFDCVEMKHKAQAEIIAEWEKRKGEFSSYEEFLESGIKESAWGRQMWEKLHRKTANVG